MRLMAGWLVGIVSTIVAVIIFVQLFPTALEFGWFFAARFTVAAMAAAFTGVVTRNPAAIAVIFVGMLVATTILNAFMQSIPIEYLASR